MLFGIARIIIGENIIIVSVSTPIPIINERISGYLGGRNTSAWIRFQPGSNSSMSSPSST